MSFVSIPLQRTIDVVFNSDTKGTPMKHEDALAHAPAAPTAQASFSGHWKNELNSTMDLNVSGNSVSGTYTSHVSGGGGQITGPIVGFVSGHVISFVVNWPNASITSWVGHLVREGRHEVIETLWYLATPTSNPNDPTELWESVFAGADRFHR